MVLGMLEIILCRLELLSVSIRNGLGNTLDCPNWFADSIVADTNRLLRKRLGATRMSV